MKYTKYSFFYPPRPKNAIPQDELEYYENKRMLTQPKLNGSNAFVAFNHEEVHVMNRHGIRMTNFKINKEEILSLHRGTGWMVLNGETLNKNQDNSFGSFNHKFVLFDILVYNGIHLVGFTFEQRINLIYELYGENTFEKDTNLNQISENVFSVKTFYLDFSKKFDEITPIPVYEGLVLKKKNSKLENGLTEMNNYTSQIKCRKQTKNYKF